MKVQLVTPYRVRILQRYGVTAHGNVTSVYPPLGSCDKAVLFISLYHAAKKIVLKYGLRLVFQSACIYVRE